MGEIPSPPDVPLQERTSWLHEAMARHVGRPRRRVHRGGETPSSGGCSRIEIDTVVVSHFVAINAAIGAATGSDQIIVAAPDYCSQTVMDVVDGRLVLVEQGFEAPDTLVR